MVWFLVFFGWLLFVGQIDYVEVDNKFIFVIGFFKAVGKLIGKAGKTVGKAIGSVFGLGKKVVAPAVAGAVVGSIFGGRSKRAEPQVVSNPYAGEVWGYFQNVFRPRVEREWQGVKSLFDVQRGLASELQNRALAEVRPLLQRSQEEIEGLKAIQERLNPLEADAGYLFSRAIQKADEYGSQIDTALEKVIGRLSGIGKVFDTAIENAKSIFESEALKGKGVMALSGFTNTPLLQRTLQEEFSRIVSPFLKEKAQTEAQAEYTLTDYIFKTPQVKAGLEKDFQSMGLFALDRRADILRSIGTLQQAQASLYKQLAQLIPSVYGSVFELGYTPTKDYAVMLRNFLDLLHINPTGAMNFAVTQRERSVFDPLGALAGGLLGWFGSKKEFESRKEGVVL